MNGSALAYASDELKRNVEIVLQAVVQDSAAWEYVHVELRAQVTEHLARTGAANKVQVLLSLMQEQWNLAPDRGAKSASEAFPRDETE